MSSNAQDKAVHTLLDMLCAQYAKRHPDRGEIPDGDGDLFVQAEAVARGALYELGKLREAQQSLTQTAWQQGFKVGLIQGQNDSAMHEKHYLLGFKAAQTPRDCNQDLIMEGKPYPRTCAVCGLGGCSRYPRG